jgi:hypothetical protein
MALKDWKKKKKDSYKKGDRLLEIHNNKTKTMPNQKKWKYSYDVAVYENGHNITSGAIFLSRKEALAFAKQYMRSN